VDALLPFITGIGIGNSAVTQLTDLTRLTLTVQSRLCGVVEGFTEVDLHPRFG